MANPMYRQIAEDLRAQIESGQLEPGQQLRTELELRDHYGASRNTVRDAIKWLTNLGLVETKPGQGTFVTQKIDPFVTTLTGDPEIGEGRRKRLPVGSKQTEQEAEVQPCPGRDPGAPDDIAAALGIPKDAEVISRHERRFIDGTLVDADLVLPDGVCRPRSGAAQERPEHRRGYRKYLADTLHIRQIGYRDRITVRAPNPAEADFFKMPPDGRVPMYEITRTAFDGNGQPMRLTVTVYPADRNQFILNVGDVPEPRKQNLHITCAY